MQRHVVICRQSNAKHSDPSAFTTLECSHGEDGWSWAATPTGGLFLLKGHIDRLIERITGVDPAGMPNITITTRDVEQVKADPPLVQSPDRDDWQHTVSYVDLLNTQPDCKSITILAPTRFEKPERTRFEYWAIFTRSIPGGIYCHDKELLRFIQRTLPDRIRSLFNDGDTRQINSPETYKSFGHHVQSEIWLRPGWQIAHPAFFPYPPFPEPKPLKPPSPEFLEAKAKGDKVRHLIRQNKSQMASRGLVHNKATNSWGKPE